MDKSDSVFADIFGQDEQINVLSTNALVSTPLITEGETYGFRYRARNIYGWGDWSETTYILAASVPDAPPVSTFVSATDNSVTVELYLTLAWNGDLFDSHELWMAEGETDIEDDFAEVDSYVPTSQSLQHTLTFAADGITTGEIYTFKFRAKNSKGYGDFSNLISIAAIDPPAKPSPPQVNYELSSSDSLFISWNQVSDQTGIGGQVAGYSLLMDNGYGSAFTQVFNTVGSSPLITDYLVTGVSLGLTYRFKVVAYNYNGLAPSPQSEISSVQACVKPSAFARPSKLTTTTSTIAINWNEPTYNGGCSITGYSVLVDDGASGSFLEANAENDQDVRLKPSLSTLLITRLQIANLGQTFRVKVKAYNPAGETESPILGVVLASLPLQPPKAVFVAGLSDQNQITIDISAFDDAVLGGGCTVTSFEIQKDNGNGGAFSSMVGGATPYLLRTLTTHDIAKGKLYRFRYRA